MSTIQLHNTSRKRISQVLAIVALTLLTVDTVNTLLSGFRYPFLPLTDQQSGIYLGLPSVVMFFLSYGFAVKQRIRLTTSILIAGGLLLAVSKIMEPIFGTNLYLVMALPYLYYSLIVIGFVIFGLGIIRAVKGNKFIGLVINDDQ